MNNVTNIYDIDGELIRTAGDNHEMTIDEAKEQLKKYEEKVKELTETDPNNSKIVIYNNYIKNLANYILTLYTKQSATISMPEQTNMTDQIKKAMDDLRDEFEKDNKVNISMLGVYGLNTSFVNSAFIQLLEHYSYDFIKKNLTFSNSNKQINDVILENFKYQTEKGKFQ